MSDEKKYDEETQKFYEANKEMVDKILAAEKGGDDPYLSEMLRRAAFERRMRLEYEAEKARREAFKNAEKAYDDYEYARDRTIDAYEENRDRFRSYAREQSDYFYDMFTDEFDHLRDQAKRGRQYFKERYEEDKDLFRESRENAKRHFNEGFDEFFAPFVSEQFQKHLVGAGLEMWMALNALIRASPLPDSVKEAFVNADVNKNREFCTKNPDCPKKPAEKEAPANAKPIKITSVKKEKK